MTITRVKKHPVGFFIFHWKNLFKLILFIAFVTTGIYMFDTLKAANYFPIKQVKIFGIHYADRQTMQTLIAPLVKKGFFGVDVENIKERLQQSPWVTKANVQRVWPDQVLIILNEKTPLARWNKNSLLSTTGEIFTPNEYPNELPQFVGPEGEQIHMMQYYTKLNKLLVPLHFKVSRLEFTPYKSWNLTFNNGVKLTAGHKDILTHVSHFVKVYPKIIGARAAEVDYVDLRYSNGLAVRWKSVS